MKPFTSLIAQAVLGLLAAVLLMSIAPSDAVVMPYLWMLFGFGLTYMGLAPFISKIYEATEDSFYLVFVGVSGMRFLVFMATLTMLMVIRPEIKSIPVTMALTLWFIAAMFIEMSVFLANLRRNSKKQS